jgi:hypothetical protein
VGEENLRGANNESNPQPKSLEASLQRSCFGFRKFKTHIDYTATIFLLSGMQVLIPLISTLKYFFRLSLCATRPWMMVMRVQGSVVDVCLELSESKAASLERSF